MRAVATAETSTVVLVEGESDRLALEAVAVRLGADLAAADAVVLPMGGVTNLHHYLAALAETAATRGRRRRVLGLFDAAETGFVRRAVDDAGLGAAGAPLEQLGFYACDPDLEGELIRALGPDRVESLLAEHGEAGRFRTFQRQPFQRGRALDAQLHRFFGTHAGRKAQFAPLLVEALDADRVPAAMTALVVAAIDG